MVGVLPVSREGDAVNEHVDACVRPEVASLSPAGQNLLVVKTNPGGAVALARSVEEVRWPEVVGAIAGQDSVFIATLGKREQLHLIARLEEFMPNRVASPVREEVSVHKRHPQPVSVL